MPGQNDARQFGGGQMDFEFNPRNIDRFPQQHYERDPRRTPSPHQAAPPPYSGRFLPPIRAAPQYRYDSPPRQGPYHPDDILPERYPYALPSEDGQWGRTSWREPPWQERRVSHTFPADSWGRLPPSPPRREIQPQPMFEPSENWKHSHATPSDHYERRRSYDFRPPEFPVRERERSLERGFNPPDQYPPPVFVPGPHYRSDPPVPLVSRTPQTYSPPPGETYRRQYNASPPWNPAPYPAPGGYGSIPEPPQFREPQRPQHWEPRFSPRAEYNTDFIIRRERTLGSNVPQEDVVPTLFRERPPPQEYHRQGVHREAQETRWPTDVLLPNLRSRPSSSTNNTQQYTGSQSRLLTPPRDNRSSPKDVVATSTDKAGLRAVEPTVQRSPDTGLVPKRASQEFIREQVRLSHTDAIVPSPPIKPTSSQGFDRHGWPSPSLAPLPQPAAVHTPQADETNEAGPLRPLDIQPEKSSDNDIPPSTSQLPASETPVLDDNPPPPARVQESPEPDVPLALQSAASKSALSTSSVPAIPTVEPATQSIPPPPSLEERLAGIPPMPLYDALRVIVMVRLQHETQTQEERVNPVLMDNLSKVEPVLPSAATSTDLIREVNGGNRLRTRENAFEATKSSLEVRFAKRQMDLNEKLERLRAEYLALHDQWAAHCAKLDEVAKNLALQEAAATAGRTTRRSAASMGDAVRSDLEMEQIIASLGNEELTDATHLGARNAAVIPDMISVTVGEVEYAFDDTNNEVDNPAEYYAPHTGIHDWTEEEVSIFVEKFAQFPKQFGLIADFLPHKTPSQCVTFYYLHKHKHIDFRKVVASRVVKRKRGGRKQKSNALLTDIRQKDAEAAPTRRRRTAAPMPTLEQRRPPSTRRAALQNENTPTATPTPEPEVEPRKRRARNTAKVIGPEADEANNDEEDATPKPAKRGKRTRKPRQSSNTPLSTPTVMEDIPPFANATFNSQGQLVSANTPSMDATVWTDSEKSLLLSLIQRFNDDYYRMAEFLPGKTVAQIFHFIRTHGTELLPGAITPSSSMGPPSLTTRTYRLSESSSESALPYEPYRIRTYSGETSGSTAAFTPSPVPPSVRHSPFEPGRPPSSASRPFTPMMSRDSFDGPSLPHPAQYPANHNMSHLSIAPIPRLGDHITNPSPFAASSPFSDYPYSHSPIPHLSAVTTLPEESRLSVPGRVDGRRSTGNTPVQSSMAFDTAPAFVPPPQTWTHAPLGTTDDLVAYLEHRTRLAQQQ